ncbi:head maturation protease, ClpP-related [Paracoccus sp. p3-h83]|uniref:head maturation protease, ClpP-related n=1 Tax=Paracoccus sp. p3-h83 TaxID=3342805 RepID=UPI0035B99EF2
MTKRVLPAAHLGARPVSLRAELSPRAVDMWHPGLQARAADGGKNAPYQIDVLEVIGEDPWTGGGVTARKIGALLRQAGDRDLIVNVNSPGGDVFEGLAVYNLLREHPGAVTVRIIGLAASAASIIAEAGDTVQIAQAGFLMIHNAWVLSAGDRHALAQTCEMLAAVDGVMADVYAARSGLAASEVTALMDRETWLSGKEAIARGLADEHLASDAVTDNAKASAAPHLRALHRADALMAQAGASRAARREIIGELTAMPRAGEDGTPGAAVRGAAADLLARLKSIHVG